MNLATLKLETIAKINATEDVELLNHIKDLLDSNESDSFVNEPISTYAKETPEKVYVLNEWQQKRIDIALKQVENGEYITDEEDQKEMQRWFEEEEKKLFGQ